MCSYAVLFSTKLSLIIAIWGCFLWWAFNWYTSPLRWWSAFDQKVKDRVHADLLDGNEYYLLYWGFPPLAISFLTIIYFALPKSIHLSHLKVSRMFYSIWGTTFVFPKPFGVVTFSEIFGMVAITILVILHVEKHTEHAFDKYQELFNSGHLSHALLWKKKMEYFGDVMGSASALTFCLLFFPVSRRSPIMRVLGIPYELALRYHVWLGHITCFFSTVHSILFSMAWAVQQHYWIELTDHKFSGLCLFIVSIIMWGASSYTIRRKYFEVFYYTHHLYLLYLLFYTFHVGGWILVYGFAALFLFFLDRLLRFLQSKHSVSVLSARLLPTGYVQIDLPMTEDLETDSLGICFLNVPTISTLQWHPFSISSHSFEKPGHVTVLIKPTRDVNSWTFQLSRLASEGLVSNVYLEGPYNSELTYFNRYDALILIAGGAGITPFRSILQEISYLHSKKLRAPSFVQLFWVVREAKELELLSSIRMEKSNESENENGSEIDNLAVRARLFVTKPEGTEVIGRPTHDPEFQTKGDNSSIRAIMPPVGSQNGWFTLFIFSVTCIGTLFIMALFCRFLLYPVSDSMANNKIVPYIRFQGIVFYFSFLFGILSFGLLTSGIVLTLFDKRQELLMKDVKDSLRRDQDFEMNSYLLRRSSVSYGTRPNWNDEIELTCENISPGSNVGVFVCGPEAMVRSVAWECQKRSLLTLHSKRLNFHPLSFDF